MQKKTNQKLEFVYEIKPTNFSTLPDDKKIVALGRFFNIISSIQKPVRILMIKEPLTLEMGTDMRTLQIPRTYLVSEEPLEQFLQQTGLEYSVATNKPKWDIQEERLSFLKLKDGSLAKCYTLYGIPATLSAAWAHQLLAYVDLVSIRMRPIENHRAISSINRIVGLITASTAKNPAAHYKYEKGMDLLQALARQETRLFKCSLVIMIRAQHSFALKLADKNFKNATRSTLSSFEATPTMQMGMLENGIGKQLYFELGSCAIFYPFVSADMIEIPNGVALGINMNTLAPVIFDYSQRDNYNILLLATSGAGKSVTAKTILARLIKKYPTSHVFVVDPNGEYEIVADFLQIQVIRATEEKELGLDPFNLFKPDDAAEIIGDISKADNVVRKEFRAKAQGCKSIIDLYEKVDKLAQSYLKDLVTGSLHEVLSGESKLEDRAVISLRGTSGEERISMLLLLALGKIWKKINSLPVAVPKILLIDEGWMLFNMSSAGKFLDMIARMGRKFNVIFIFITQRPEDVIENQYGRAIAENAATKIFLQNTEQASEKIKKAMDLSEQEADMLKTLSRGQCLFLTKDYRLRVQITPSDDELKVFSTTPMDK
ncbi:VirB4 family type IV secretion system protein [Candidatus Nitrosotenuis uzonensis]|uniref:VirB4 family type IV secretion system protein n=1 Tax=Candidatus Nitrosotenuis uzonensis TaxID=1407055 RepID=UPI0015A5A610|nr:ATP-binding protein [Candidatus Nitrosotenuis uzonensis]